MGYIIVTNMYINTHTYIHTYIHTHTQTHTHAHAYAHSGLHACTHKYKANLSVAVIFTAHLIGNLHTAQVL